MSRSNSDIKIRKYLPAFADGELDIQQNLDVLEHMAINPMATRRVMHQQQLREAIKRTLHRHTPTAPESLKLKLQELSHRTPCTTEPTTHPGTTRHRMRPTSLLARIGRWTPVTVAALLFVSALAVLGTANRSHGAIPQARYAMFAHRHTRCSRQVRYLNHTELFPQNLENLPEAMARFLGNTVAIDLDLSPAGYEFLAIGQCDVPGDQSVHLVYRNPTAPHNQGNLSLWIRQHTGNPDIEPNRLYLMTGSNATSPMLLWQQDKMIYYLVGDSLGGVEHAAGLLRSATPEARRPK